MFKKIVPLLILSISVGLMTSCSSSSPLIDKAESQIAEQNYDAAIAASKKFIQQQPNNPAGYYYKGVALGQKGQAQKMPAQGTEYFKQMNDAFSQAKELASQMESVPEEVNRIKSVKTAFWRVAHNKGVNYVRNDSLKSSVENPLEIAIAYLHNAIIIQPLHAVTYQALALVSGRKENYEQAAKAQKKYISMADSVSARNYLVLAQYYRNADKPEEALQVLLQTQEKYPNNITVVEILADTYTQLGNYEKAILIVEQLVEQNPENPQYHMALGSRILTSAMKLQEKYEANMDQIFQLQRQDGDQSAQVQALKQENKELAREIDNLTQRAAEQFKLVLQYQPDNVGAYNNLGIIHQNKAAMLYGKRNLASSQAEAAKYDQQADEELREAMKYYQKAVELEPENTDYWKSLYIVYTNLGMDKKAKKAAQKAGIDLQ